MSVRKKLLSIDILFCTGLGNLEGVASTFVEDAKLLPLHPQQTDANPYYTSAGSSSISCTHRRMTRVQNREMLSSSAFHKWDHLYFTFFFWQSTCLFLDAQKLWKNTAQRKNLYNLKSQNWHRTSKLFSYEVAEEHLSNENVNKNNII